VGIGAGPAGVDAHVVADLPTRLPQSLQKCCDARLPYWIVRSIGHQHADPPHTFRLLRTRHQGPHGCAADQHDELAPVHSIPSSARSRNDSGIVRPNALAVVRLITSSNLVGCSTGMSPGFVPRRILSTNSAARRNWAGKFAP